MASSAKVLQVPAPDGAVRDVRISSPDRVMWKDAGITKWDLATYVASVGRADRARRRPAGDAAALPRGHRGRGVLLQEPTQGRARLHAHGHVHLSVRAPAPAARRRRGGQRGVGRADEHHHLPPVAGAHGRHRQPGRAAHRPRPTAGARVHGCGRGGIRPAGGDVRDRLTAWAKTSGNRGVHVYARVAPTHEFLDVRHGVIGIARELERRLPDLVTTSWWKEERGERIFVDFNQACRDRTIASAYSPRPLPGAPVSMPGDVGALRVGRPRELTLRTVPALWPPAATPGRGSTTRWATSRRPSRCGTRTCRAWARGSSFPPDYPKMPGEPPRVQPSPKTP